MTKHSLRSIACAAVVAVTATCLSPACATSDASRPNIVIIIADDLGWEDVGHHGGAIPTPNIDTFAEEGIELGRFYTAPMCSPTRAGLMTGRHPIRFGMGRSVVTPWCRYGIDPGEITLAECVAKAGYENRALFGKWHLGHLERKWHPLQQGFTHFEGHYNGAIDYFTQVRQGERDWHVDYEPHVTSGYATDLIADAAVGFIERHAKNPPFFVVVSFNAPHIPLQAPDEYLRRFDRLAGDAQTYAAMVACLDDGIGRVLDAIDRNGIRDNTFIWFMSDNGGTSEATDNNRPLRGRKLQVFEGGVRVPASVRWPVKFEGGRRVDTPTAYIDVLPTVMEAAGIGEHGGKPPDGTSLLGLFEGKASIPPRELYFYEGLMGGAEQIAVTAGEWKLIIVGPDVSNGVSGRHERLLFRITDDPNERTNVAASHTKVVDELTERLVAFRRLQPRNAIPPASVGRDGFVPPKDWRIPAR